MDLHLAKVATVPISTVVFMIRRDTISADLHLLKWVRERTAGLATILLLAL